MPPVFLGAGVLVFIVMRVIPGDVVGLIVAGESGFIVPEDREVVAKALGLDRPLLVQLADWLWKLIRFDFGTSLYTGKPVMSEIARRAPLTGQLALMALTMAVVISIPLGAISGVFADKWPDYVIRVFTIAGLATPSFWLGILILVALVIFFNWSPPLEWYRIWQNPVENMKVMVWPAAAVAYRMSAVIVRMTRSTMLEVLNEDYVRTARAKGLKNWLVIYRHALRNAVLPVITVIGFEAIVVISGLIVTEKVFNVPGLGQYLVTSILRRDYTSAQAIIMLITGGVLLINLLVDLIYVWLDPRIRYA